MLLLVILLGFIIMLATIPSEGHPGFWAKVGRKFLKKVLTDSESDEQEHARWPGPLNFTPTAITIPPYYPPFPILYPDNNCQVLVCSLSYRVYPYRSLLLSALLTASFYTLALLTI